MNQQCNCEGPGYCSRHQRAKTEAEFALCKSSQHWRTLWDLQAASGERTVCADWESRGDGHVCVRCGREHWGDPPDNRPCVLGGGEQEATTRRLEQAVSTPEVFCAEWEKLGETMYRCKRCTKPYAANHESLLPKERKCIVATPMPVNPKPCTSCGGAPKPTFVEKVKTVAAAAVDFVASGFDLTTGEELATRKETCESCSYRDGGNCRVCGCVLEVKQRERAAHCPMGFWPANEYPWLPGANDEWLKEVAVAIPAYRKHELTTQAVTDCFREPVHVGVIDSAGDYKPVAQEHVIRDGKKRVWGEACLLAMKMATQRASKTRYLVLLNNDVRLSERFFSGLLVAQGATGAGIVSACYSSGYGEQLHSGAFSGPAKDFIPTPVHRQVTRIDGTCVLFTVECLQKIGVFDLSLAPEYGWGLMTDMCIRARQAGIKIVVTESAYCEHLEGGCQTAKEFYGNLQTYRHGANREMEEGLTRQWGAGWRMLLTTPIPRSRAVTTLNLIYHVWPVSTNERWKWNVEQLLKRIEIFNGKRVVAIATGENAASVAEVKAAFAGHRVEFIEKPNSKQYREANTFLELLDAVKTDDPSEATFYAHAKGVSRPEKLAETHWAALMYRELLDDPGRVRRALSLKGMLGVGFDFDTPWIFPGTFWWFHSASLFSKPNWRTLDNPITHEGVGWSAEAFPNRFFPNDHERIRAPLQYPSKAISLIYDSKFWSDQDSPMPKDWLDQHLAELISNFDEEAYLRNNPDVARDVPSIWPNGLAHYKAFGWKEGRKPR